MDHGFTLPGQPVAPHDGPCDHGPCSFLAVIATADDDSRCCIAHHPEARHFDTAPLAEDPAPDGGK